MAHTFLVTPVTPGGPGAPGPVSLRRTETGSVLHNEAPEGHGFH